MKYTLCSIFCCFLLFPSLNGQKSEYRYFSFRTGLVHNFLHPQPNNPIDIFVLGADNQLHQLKSDEGYLYDYSATFNADILYHFDFVGDKSGIVTGLGFQNKNYVFEYSTDYYNYTLHDIFSVNQLSLPLFLKYGNDIWNSQRYFTLGARLNYNIAFKNKNNYQQNNKFWLRKKEYNPFSLTFLLGFNYCVYNFEIEYQINSVFNQNFQNINGNHIYAGQNGNFFVFKTTFHFPNGYNSEFKGCWGRLAQPIWIRPINMILGCFGLRSIVIRRVWPVK